MSHRVLVGMLKCLLAGLAVFLIAWVLVGAATGSGPALPGLPLTILVGGLLVLAAALALKAWRLAAELRLARQDCARAEADRDAAINALSERHGFETLGRLTANIAHDLGNTLQLISVYLGAMPDSMGDRAALGRIVENARRATERGAVGVRTILALARGEAARQAEPGGEESAPRADAAYLLTELAGAMRDLLGPGFAVQLDLDADLPPILATQDDLEAMLVNLATNARDAMAAKGAGTLFLSARSVHMRKTTEGDLPPGPWVRIGVADTGHGMDAETLAHATEPFFTTKPRGRGTGLGLALVRTFAERCGGVLRIESTPDLGTSAQLYLRPAPEERMEDETHADSVVPRPQQTMTAGATRHAAA